jgi:hypothetical protein
MAGLNDLVTNKEIQTTSLPSWYSSAQQNLVNQATGVNAPALADTAAQSAVSAFGAGSPFTAGQNILQSIGSGAANPWMVTTDATGAQTVSPNVATPLGGLFAAQRDYLGQIMPDIEAAETAGSIAGGDFGSRMNLSGVQRERAKAFADLAQKQMQSALQAQQYGVAAGAGLSDIGQELVQSAINTGTFQQNAPYASATNLANILGKVTPEKDMTKSVQLGGLNQIMGLLSATQGGLGSLMGTTRMVDGKPVRIPGLIEQIKSLYRGNAGEAPSLTDLITNPAEEGQPGYGWQYYSDGTVIDPAGNYYRDGQLIWSPSPGIGDYESDNTYNPGDYDFGYGSDPTDQDYTSYDFGYGENNSPWINLGDNT